MWIFELFERLLFYVAQIGTRSGFPDPLSPKEEQELLLRMQSGDGEARCSLIEHNLRLVAHIAKKYASGPDADDLISIGTIGLIKAVNTYDPSKSVRLAAYASRCIENEILMHLRAAKRRKNDISLQEPVGSDKEGNEISLMDILSPDSRDAADSIDYLLHRDQLRAALSALPKRERTVIALRYGLGTRRLTQKQVASLLGISRSYVSRLEKKAIERMRGVFFPRGGKE